ncbi:hypothetical protein BV20DRAFT_982315 [Pilatotrama ljubarskyi]|nr:hypothetical protein BV20DRAFT_982315 [Pilatotrama ljubarskyi]
MSHTDSFPPPSTDPSCSKAIQSILAGRKCYRVSKDKNEVVWPPHLEAALMEGLSKYTPAESRSPRGLTRFPNRNKFISQYIRQKTGEIRTAKQVGSRIQQLRDTNAGKSIVKAFSDRQYEMMHPTRRQTSEEQDPFNLSAPSVTLSAGSSSALVPSIPPVVQVYISVPPANFTPPHTAGVSASPGLPTTSHPTEVHVVPNSVYQFVEARSLHKIDPTVTFVSSSPMPLFSRCNVYRENTIVHVGQPVTMGVRASDHPEQRGYLHSTELAPGYWQTLCRCEDLSPYTIVQEITKNAMDSTQKPAVVMHISYQFIQASTGHSPPLSPFSLNQEFDYDADSGSDVFPSFPGQPMSTGSESPLPSDRSSSPSHSMPAGFASQPISPIGWGTTAQGPWATFDGVPGPSTQLQEFPTAYYGFQTRLQPVYNFQNQQQPTQHLTPPPGQFYGPPPF